MVRVHPLFAGLCNGSSIVIADRDWPADGWAVVTPDGWIQLHPRRVAAPEQWAHVVAHCLLHLGMDHFQDHPDPQAWNIACDAVVTAFLRVMKFGQPVEALAPDWRPPARDEKASYEHILREGVPVDLRSLGTAGTGWPDMVRELRPAPIDPAAARTRRERWARLFGAGLTRAVHRAVEVAGGGAASLTDEGGGHSAAKRAKAWFISSFPLLGALAAGFTVIEDALVCIRMDIAIAAISDSMREIYINPAANLDENESRFVMAHEFLHVGLRHEQRAQGRDPYLWNVACDYVINGWLIEMGLGSIPRFGGLYDPELKGLSAESIYDRIVVDMRRIRKLATLRGVGLGDMLPAGDPSWWSRSEGMSLDDFYRRALMQGLEYHDQQGRGLVPAGLVEEIRALGQPPIGWDVQLAMWFDGHFAPLEMRRSYARPSRRQSSTPDIPRPRWVPAAGAEDGRTFGVVLDTSGSMDRHLLAMALGAIASYSIARDVPAVRVVFCDAAAHDAGYMPPEAILERVRIHGRGGTVLQPAVDLLEKAEDFSAAGPLLIITDGRCDRLRVRRDHAFLLPRGRSLPFVPRGPVFHLS